jgi:glycosyltransferase involved in cell wall biosynthesis
VRRAGLPALFSIHNDWLRYSWEADQWMRIWPKHARVWARAAELAVGVPTAVDIAASGPLLFNSRFMQRSCAQAGIDTLNSRVIHPGISRRFQRLAEDRPWRWRLLYVGRLDHAKGVDTAVAALDALPADVHLAIYGKGDPGYAAQLRSCPAVRDGRVTLGEFRGDDELVAAYRAADAVLFPVRWEEPWGLVPLEAMGLGRPVICTGRGGTAEFVRDGVNALVVEPDDPRGLAAAVSRLADSEDLRRTIVDGGRRTAANYTAERFDAETLEAIESHAALSARGPARTDGRSRWSAPG